MEQTGEKKDNFLPISILVASFVIGGSFIYGAGAKTQERQAPLANVGNAVAGLPTVQNVSIDDDIILGNPQAPVTVIEFGDYQCPFCGRFFTDAEKQVRDNYVATGKVRMVYRDFPLDNLHPFARPAAEAAECARDQGQYWAYHDLLFTRQDQLPTLNFVSLAKELGLDDAAFKTCVDTKKYAKEVETDYQDGLKVGVSGTPTAFVNGKMLSGALPYETFKSAIEDALSKAPKQ